MTRFSSRVQAAAATVLFSAFAFAGTAQAQGPGHPSGPPSTGGHAPGMPPGGPGGQPGPPPSSSGGSSGTAANNAARGSASNGTPMVTTRAGVRLGPAGRWWDESGYVSAIGISKSQQARMDAVFNANKAAIVGTYKTWSAEQAKLNTLTQSGSTDQAKVFSAIDSVNQAHAALEKADTQMRMQVMQQLDAEQVRKLDSLK